MRKISISLVLLSSLACASVTTVNTIKDVFSKAEVSGNIKYYYIDTDKDSTNLGKSYTSSHANSIGGQLHYQTASLYGFDVKATFMTTNAFLLPNVVDTSIIGRDNAVALGKSPGDIVAQESFSVLGEILLSYKYSGLTAWMGRNVIKTPLINAKEVRMLPSAVQGYHFDYAFKNGAVIGASYLDFFKQRTSYKFTNIIEHALGVNTQAITGSTQGSVVVANMGLNLDTINMNFTNYYASNFMNSFYAEIDYRNSILKESKFGLALQGLSQSSIGNADNNLEQASSITGGKRISTSMVGVKAHLSYHESKLYAAYTYVDSDKNSHDSLILPWDGTPLFTNMITSNNLFQSNYGKALNADSAYIGGTHGSKLAFQQGYNFTGVNGFKSLLAVSNYTNHSFLENQRDLNAVVSYSYDTFSIALKGIFVQNNTTASANGTITQTDHLTQYRVIANYKF